MRRQPPKKSKATSPVYASPPDPRALFEEAEQEPNYRALCEYTPVISKLREKGFSFREIAEWLSERGVDVDHNAVYRIYTNRLSDYEAAMVEEQEDREAEMEAFRNR
jgi:hypothetical protein